MNLKTGRDVLLLKAYAAITTLMIAVLAFSAFKQANQKPKFEEIDVERINIVEKDGKVKLVISNKERAPDQVLNGKVYSLRQGGRSPGMIFYNDNGDECGGLTFSGGEKDGKRLAGAGLLFDQYNQDQTVGVTYSENDGRRSAGLRVWDRPDRPIDELADKLEAIRNMKDGPEKTDAMKKLQDAAGRGEYGTQRVFVGKSSDKSAAIMLADVNGKPRLTLTVDQAGAPKLNFLDEGGKVIYSLPEETKKR